MTRQSQQCINEVNISTYRHILELLDVLGQLSEQFAYLRDEESHWELAQKVTQELGGNALNIAVASQGGGMSWARAGMSQVWLNNYGEQKFHLVDPFLASLMNGHSRIATDSAVLSKENCVSNAAISLNHELKDFGYGSLTANTFGNIQNGEMTMVVHCSSGTNRDTNRALGLNNLRIVHAIIAANITQQARHSDDSLILGRPSLTVREKDILRWLACGYRNDEIAFRCGIAEITVRKHLLSIRRKLRAPTRENAIAIAMRDGLISL